MPYYARRKVAYRRRRPYRKVRRHNLDTLHGKMVMGRAVPYLPPFRRARMRWVTATTSGASTLGAYVTIGYAANDIYNVAGGTRQPYGWDQLGALYQHWIVLGSKITWKILPTDSTFSPDVPYMFGTYINSTSTGYDYNDWRDPIEARRGSWVGPVNGCETSCRTLTEQYSPKKYYGAGYDPSVAIGTAGTLIPASPTNRDFFVLWYQPANRTSSVIANYWQINITIDYYVYWFEPVPVLSS